MPETPTRRRRGRPQITDEAKVATLTTRISPTVKARLDAAARANARSTSREVELRLEASFSLREDVSTETRHLLAVAAEIIDRIEQMTGRPWAADRFTFEALAAAIPAILRAMAPAGEASPPARLSEIAEVSPLPRELLMTPAGLGGALALGAVDQYRDGEIPTLLPRVKARQRRNVKP